MNRFWGVTFLFACTVGGASPVHAEVQLAQQRVLPVTRSSITSATQATPQPKLPLAMRYDQKTLKGWNYLIGRLIDQGFSEKKLITIFSDPRMPKHDPLFFSLRPRVEKYRYRFHLSAARRKNALEFYKNNRLSFDAASRRYNVPQSVLLSVLQVETNCGQQTGRSNVFYRLARLASAAAPENIDRNFRESRKSNPKLQISIVAARAKEIEETFLPHAGGTLLLAAEKGVDPLELRGSSSGAIGIPQFLPGNHFLFGVDGDGDGEIDLFNNTDAIYSLANFLSSYGWKKTSTLSEKRAVIWEYNHSAAYVETVLKLANLLEHDLRKVKI